MKGKTSNPNKGEVKEEDDFDVENDKDADGGINVPVSRFESKFLGNKEGPEEQKKKPLDMANVYSLSTDRTEFIIIKHIEIQDCLQDAEKKEQLISQLLKKGEQKQPIIPRKQKGGSDKSKDEQAEQGEGNGEENPEKEQDFKKAYNKVI